MRHRTTTFLNAQYILLITAPGINKLKNHCSLQKLNMEKY